MNNFLRFVLLYLCCLSAYAVDVTVNLNGGILAQSCNVSSQDLTKNINFPEFNPGDFGQTGATSAEQPISILLNKCTGNVANLSYQFSGEGDTTDPTLLKVTGKGGVSEDILATGLAIEILDKNKKKIALNALQPLNEIISSATYNLNFYLRYKSTNNNVGSGDASSIVYLDIFYE